jgi:diguanylate cyclase (GGDEF)-like protein
MKRILVVEDNKALAKMLALKIEANLPFEVDNAYSMKEAQLFIRKFDYFIALLDINLPDAPHGEIVDVMLDKAIRSIVLSGNMDRKFRHEMLKKEIIDYVGKGGVEDVDFVIATIRRLHKNLNHTVMIVDDSMIFRKQIKIMLENLFFKVIACAHGEEAINLLQERDDISMVITDYAMPVMNGLELTQEIRRHFSKEQLSIIGISGNDDEDIPAMFLKKGATDYIKKPFSKEEFSCRINNTIEASENIATITNGADRDYVTGLYNRRYFMKQLETYLQNRSAEGSFFALAIIGIDHFKKISDTYGDDVGKQIIVHCSEILRCGTNPNDLVAHFGAEEFGVLLKEVSPNQAQALFEELRASVETSTFRLNDAETLDCTVSIGYTCEPEASSEEMLNQADMMLYHVKNEGANGMRGN